MRSVRAHTMRRPRFIAEQARNASGPLGRLVAFIMARETWADNLAAMDALGIQPADHVLDIGCGHGRALGELARRAPKGRVVGADPSKLMVEIAIERNRALVRADRMQVIRAGVDQLPVETAIFDKILCVHGVYFWSDLEGALCEIARVLKTGGRAVLALRTSANSAAGAFPSEVYRFRSRAEIERAIVGAGMRPTTEGDVDERHRGILVRADKPR